MEATRKVEPYWSGSQWGVYSRLAAETHFSFLAPQRLACDERGSLYFLECAPPRVPGATAFHVVSAKDGTGEPLIGGRTYRLRVPPNPPVRQHWAVTVYDLETAGFIHNAPTVCIDPYNPHTGRNADGSIDVHFTPKPRAKENSWIYTGSRGQWIAMFRFEGPRRAVFDKSWILPNIERV